MGFEDFTIINAERKVTSYKVDFTPPNGQQYAIIRNTTHFSYLERIGELFKSIAHSLGLLLFCSSTANVSQALSRAWWGYEHNDTSRPHSNLTSFLISINEVKVGIKEPTEKNRYINNYDNVEFISKAIQSIHDLYPHTGENNQICITPIYALENDPTFMLKAIGEDPSFIRFASNDLKNNVDFMLQALDKSKYSKSQRDEFLKHLPDSLKNNGKIALKLITAFDEKADIVLVGGGPVGLSTAIRTCLNLKSQNKTANIVILEKSEYDDATQTSDDKKSNRRNQPLSIDPELLLQDLPEPESVGLTQGHYSILYQHKIKNDRKPIPTREIENGLKELAVALGIEIRIKRVQDAKELPNQFPKAKWIGGTAGAYDVIRQQFFGDKLKDKVDLQYLAQLKTKGKGDDIGSSRMMIQTSQVGDFAEVGDEPNGTSIRIFIDEATYKELENTASGGSSINFDGLSNKYLKEQFNVFLKAKNVFLDGNEIITVIRIGHYVSEKCVLEKKGVKLFLVGDSFMGTPYRTSLSNGVKCSIEAAKDLSGDFLDKKITWFENYASFAQNLAWKQIPAADFKNFFVSIVRKFFSIGKIFLNVITGQIFADASSATVQTFKLVKDTSKGFVMEKFNSSDVNTDLIDQTS